MSTGPLQGEVRFRVPLPIVIPLGGLLLIAAVTIGVSRILLSVPKEAAVVIALALAGNVLIACSILALKPQESRWSWAELFVVASYPVVIGIVIANLGLGSGVHAGEEPHKSGGVGATGGALQVEAANVAFGTSTIELPADEEAQLEFTNADSSSVSHNIAIYEDDSASKSLFQGEVIPGDESITYDIPPIKKGTYYFQCDVHPGMNGEVVVE
jgi:plastocyanin